MTKAQQLTIELFDTHAHLDMFDSCCEKILCSNPCHFDQFPDPVNYCNDFQLSNDFQIAGVVIPGISHQSSRRSVQFAQQCDLFHAAVGIHPNSTGDASPNDWSEIVEISRDQNVTSIGETGLDRYRDTVPFEIQLQYFELHLDLASERGLPIIVHSRDCDDDMLSVLGNRAKVSPIFGVIHSFSSTPAVAEKYLEMGLFISFSGTVTYTNRKFFALRETAKIVPDDRLLIETDAPFLTPHPYRRKLNENMPIMTAYTARTLAGLRGTTIGHIAAVTTANARKIFRKK